MTSRTVAFPGGSRARRAICLKVIDSLYVISVRIGREMTRQLMTTVLQRLFAAFDVQETVVNEGQSSSPSLDSHPGSGRYQRGQIIK